MTHFEHTGNASIAMGQGVKPFPRQSAFCVLAGKVGIIFEYPQVNATGDEKNPVSYDPSSAVVHFMNAKGETNEVVRNVPVNALSIAPLSKIPASRRPTDAQAKRFGYK